MMCGNAVLPLPHPPSRCPTLPPFAPPSLPLPSTAVGTKVLQKARVAEVLLDDLCDPEACAEGSVLSLFSFDALKSEKKRKKIPKVQLLRSTELSYKLCIQTR